MYALLPVLVLGAGVGPGVPRPAPPSRLETAAAVRALTPTLAAAGRAVSIRGVVTYLDADHRTLAVQDRTAGVHVRAAALPAGLRVGDEVAVEGVTTHAAGAGVRVTARALTPTGQHRFPDPVPLDPDPARAALLDGQFVWVNGTVRGVRAADRRTLVRVATARGPVDLALAAGVPVPRDGAAVEIRGVCGGPDGPPPGGGPVVLSGAVVVVLDATLDPSDLPAARVIADPAADQSRPVRLAGKVTAVGRGDYFLQDATGAVRVTPADRTAPPPVGAWVEVTGLRGETAGRLDAARFRSLARPPGPDPQPAAVALPRLVGGFPGVLVRAEGQVVAVDRAAGRTRVTIAADGATAAATLDGGADWPADVRPGARVAVVGVNLGPRPPAGPEVLLRSAADLTVLEPPPYWTGERVRALVGAVTGFGLVALAAAVAVRVRSRRLAAAVRADAAKYRALYEHAADPVFTTDPAGRITDLNRAAERLFGCDRAAAVGTGLERFVPAEQVARLREALAHGRDVTLELTVTPAAGEPAAVEVALRPRAGGGAEAVARDVTDRKQLEGELRQAGKMAAVGRLAGGIAHDFNNLLTVINGCAELLTHEVPSGTRAGELAADIRKAGTRAAGLTGQLLLFSKKRPVSPTAVDLNGVVAETAQLLGRVIGERVRVQLALAPGLPAVRAEAGLVSQVLVNLAVNARDAMPHGGTLTLATGRPGPDEDPGFVRLSVADTGTGIPPDVQARIFDPFFTTKESGTGLGLATVLGVVDALGGRVRVGSAVGRGTRFDVDLPQSGDDPTPWPEARKRGHDESGAAPSAAVVLLVEDDDAVRALTRQVLEMDGMTVLAAEAADEGLELAGGYPGRIDVLMTDVVMPGMNGRELADAVRGLRPGVRVLFTSGYTADEVIRQGVREEEVEFLQKPYTPAGLVAKITEVIAGRTAAGAG